MPIVPLEIAQDESRLSGSNERCSASRRLCLLRQIHQTANRHFRIHIGVVVDAGHAKAK